MELVNLYFYTVVLLVAAAMADSAFSCDYSHGNLQSNYITLAVAIVVIVYVAMAVLGCYDYGSGRLVYNGCNFNYLQSMCVRSELAMIIKIQ